MEHRYWEATQAHHEAAGLEVVMGRSGDARVHGHNRWHPEIAPIMSVRRGEVVTLDVPIETGDQIGPHSTHRDLLAVDFSDDLVVGPIYVEDAKPGDVLVVEILAIHTGDFGYSGIYPGFGFLADIFMDPYLVTWRLQDGFARTDQLPGIAIPAAPFPGTIGVAPSHEFIETAHGREHELVTRAGLDFSEYSMPPIPPTAASGLTTLPPREIGGNLDVRQLTVGARLLLPIQVPGALLSLGDMHFAQGEGEVCGTALETAARVDIRVDIVTSPSWTPRFPMYETPLEGARRFIATSGISIDDCGTNELLDINLAARRALIELIDYLVATYGFAPEAAYILASVAADLRVSATVDLPNALVSALLPLDIFEHYRSPA